MTQQNIGVLLVNLGTPSKPTTSAVKSYLKQFLSDRRVIDVNPLKWRFILNWLILPRRSPRVAKLYKEIWTDNGSPLLAIGLEQRQGLINFFKGSIENITFDLAMTYGEPSIDKSIAQMINKKIDRLIVLPLYPQYSSTTTASVFDAVARVLNKHRYLPKLEFIHSYHNHPFYIEALVNSINIAFSKNMEISPLHNPKSKLLFSYHGIPQAYEEKGDYYRKHCIETSVLVAKKLGLVSEQYVIAFQSRFGKDPWLQPYTDQIISDLPQQGIDALTVICPGFAADCLETIEEIDQENRDLFIKAGGRIYNYVPALNASPDHIKLLSSLINGKIRD